jgi:polysaccharide deacetylase family protein (PEP-CTERM system associated)
MSSTLSSALERSPGSDVATQVVVSFDVEEHYRIESAAGLALDAGQKAAHDERLVPSCEWLLEQLARQETRATFFILGQIARDYPKLVEKIDRSGHEIASHGWDHRRLHHLTPETFREDLRLSKDALEQAIGKPIVGYRAPTFSVLPQTAWAVDVLVEQGFRYDSSIFPVRHDRYGVPRAPRAPFRLRGPSHEILELPILTLRLWRMNLPVGGGGYFRLFPLGLLERGLRQVRRHCRPPVAMLYFHPWEFDPGQPRLPLRRLNRFRTYVGIRRSQRRLVTLLSRHRFARAVDLLPDLEAVAGELPQFDLAAGSR